MVIPAKRQVGNNIKKAEKPKLRVAAYCRVSTDSDEQATSYEAQIEHYTEYISKNPEWVLAGIFADDGITGTNTKKRDEFNRMIEECRAGNIDMIITKSISRFACNTLDCLKYIRELKDLNISVFFEKESINTMDAKGEVLLTIMASLAQQESQSLSQNVKLGIQYRYQQGKVQINHNRFLGYTKDADGNLVIEPEQAEIVRRIYREYLQGLSMDKIAAGLEADGILTGAGKTKWHTSIINKILRNEKYIGDALLQKTYTTDFLTKKRIKNNGTVPQYYVEGDHEAIIPKDIFLLVQEELVRRRVVHTSDNGKRHIKAILPLSGERPSELLRAHIRQQKAASQEAPAPEPIYKVHTNPRSDSRENLCFLQAYIPQEDGKAQIGDVLYIGTPEKCRELMAQLNAGELTQGEVKELYAKAQEAGQDKDTFSIYQLKRGDETRDLRFEPYDRLQATGHAIDRANYELIYTAPLTPDTSLEDIYTRFNLDHPADFKGHSLSVSDIVVLHRDGRDAAHYVDSIGYREVPEFFKEQGRQLTPDELETGETVKTPRGTFYVTAMSREQMEVAGYGLHHQSEDGNYLIMRNGTRAFAIPAEQPEKVNPLKHIEDAVEQNDNALVCGTVCVIGKLPLPCFGFGRPPKTV